MVARVSKPNSIPRADRQAIALKSGPVGSKGYKNALNQITRYGRGEVKNPKNPFLIRYLTKQKNPEILKTKKHKESKRRAVKGKKNLKEQNIGERNYVWGPRRRAIPDNWIPIKIIDDDIGIMKDRPTIADCIQTARELCDDFWLGDITTIFENEHAAEVVYVAAWVQPAGNYDPVKFKTPETRKKPTELIHHNELVRVVVWIAVEGT